MRPDHQVSDGEPDDETGTPAAEVAAGAQPVRIVEAHRAAA